MKGEFFIKILLELILQPVRWARFFFFVVSSFIQTSLRSVFLVCVLKIRLSQINHHPMWILLK